jgi:hypothetical protein
VRNGTAKMLTLFCSGSSEYAPNALLHPWQLEAIDRNSGSFAASAPVTDTALNHALWASWQQGLKNGLPCRQCCRRYACCWSVTTCKGI